MAMTFSLSVLEYDQAVSGDQRCVIVTVNTANPGLQRAAHRQPHDHFNRLCPAFAHVMLVAIAGEGFGIALEQVEKTVVPIGIHEAETLTMKLMRHAAGADDHDPYVGLIAFDRMPQGMA